MSNLLSFSPALKKVTTGEETYYRVAGFVHFFKSFAAGGNCSSMQSL